MNNTLSKDFPFVSIIMPVRNEAEFIEESLAAVLEQDYPPKQMEVIVVNGMSDDGTKAIVEKMIIKKIQEGKAGPDIFVLDNPSCIVPVALNIGLIKAKGDVIIRVDGHSTIALDYVRRCVETLLDTGAECVGGLQYPVAKSLAGRAVALAITTPFGVGNAKFRYREKAGWVDTVYLGAYWRKVFEKNGNFDEELVRNQDDEFNFRLLQSGGKIWLDLSIRSEYYCRSSLTGLWRQYFQYGFWKVKVIQKRGAVPSWRSLVPPFFVLCIAIGGLLSLFAHNSLSLLITVAAYGMVNLCVSIWLAFKKSWKALFLLPLIFSIIHVAYGTGFLCGIVKRKKYSYKT